MTLLFLGISGSGKDTQAQLLAKKHGMTVISTGTLVRDEIEEESEVGKKIESIVKEGSWVEDEIIYSLLEQRLSKIKDIEVILTGAVREEAQVKMLDDALMNIGRQVDKVILFELPENDAIERLSGRRYATDGTMYHTEYDPPPEGLEVGLRDDDDTEAIKHRFAEYNESIQGILADYESRGILLRVNASPSIQEIHQTIARELGRLDL